MTNAFEIPGYKSKNNNDESQPSSPDEEFVFIKDEEGLPIRQKKPPPPEYPLSLELHPIEEESALLVSLHPPRRPEIDIGHVPCDVVLVIDVSGSMADLAELPDSKDKADKEFTGLSILDLTKHAARTVLETLNEGDRLAIVTFSQRAKVIQTLTPMTKKAKKETNARIEKLEDEGATNLWDGIRTGLKVIEDSSFIGNVQGIFVLTDGMPNHMCPQQGYVAKLAPMLEQMAQTRPCVPSIHTFGFGYTILSNLLQSIAETGNGNYAFIPECGMIGTVFVHAVANLYSTYATSATLKITAAKNVALKSDSGILTESPDPSEIHLKLGNIQYGQSRDNIIHISNANTRLKSHVTATLTYKLPSGESQTIIQAANLSHKTELSQSVKSYHLNRNTLCAYLSALFPLTPNGQHLERPSLPLLAKTDLVSLSSMIQRRATDLSDPDNLSLLHDLHPSAPGSQDGQVSQALTQESGKSYWQKWGRHYLPSLLHAHLHQQCNSFKDPGPQRYGTNSPLFVRCRNELDKAFDNLPAPKPSLVGDNLRRVMYSVSGGGGGYSSTNQAVTKVSMSRYNYAGNPCFLGSSLVKVADETKRTSFVSTCSSVKLDGAVSFREIKVEDLRAGMSVLNLLTGETREVAAILKTPFQPDEAASLQQICRISTGATTDLWITPYHPVYHRQKQRWVFPIQIAAETRPLVAGEAVYSVMLSPAKSSASHAMEVSGMSCVTLGHGLTSARPARSSSSSVSSSASSIRPDDPRIHTFFGNYDAVWKNVTSLKRDHEGRHVSGGVMRNISTDLVSGFIPDFISGLDFGFDSKMTVAATKEPKIVHHSGPKSVVKIKEGTRRGSLQAHVSSSSSSTRGDAQSMSRIKSWYDGLNIYVDTHNGDANAWWKERGLVTAAA